jgi:uroporphyrinogen-III synthase
VDLHRHEDPSSGTLAARAFTSNEICIEKQDASNQKAPAMREVPLESPEALGFARGLLAGKFDMVIFLTGAGIRALVGAVQHAYPREQLASALQRVQVVARGSKPVSALRELGVKPNLVAPEPNTWRELLRVLDDAAPARPLRGLQVAVQEYGVPPQELLAGLRERGAHVTAVPVFNGLCQRTFRHCKKP